MNKSFLVFLKRTKKGFFLKKEAKTFIRWCLPAPGGPRPGQEQRPASGEEPIHVLTNSDSDETRWQFDDK
jgi:hypothetical protein